MSSSLRRYYHSCSVMGGHHHKACAAAARSISTCAPHFSLQAYPLPSRVSAIERWSGGNDGRWISSTAFANNWRMSEGYQRKNNVHSVQHVSHLRWRSFSRDGAHHHARKNASKGPDMRNCQSIEEIAQMAHDNLDNMWLRDISAFWTLVSRMIKNNNHRGDHHNRHGTEDQQQQQLQQLTRQLNSVFILTMDSLQTFGPRELAQTAIGFARIANTLDNGGRNQFRGNPHKILQGIIVGQQSQQKDFIFQSIANASMPALSKFDAQCLCNLAYANAIAGSVPAFGDGSTLFDRIAKNGIRKIMQFKPQELANVVWSFEKVGQSNPRLFEEVADQILSLDDIGKFKPQELSNIVLAFAKAGEKNPELFRKLAEHMVALPDFGWFNSQDLSTIVWSFAKAEESNPTAPLFKKVADHIVALDHLHSFQPRHISMIVWAYATAKDSNQRLFGKVADHIIALDNLSAFKPQELSSILLAFAKAGESNPRLFTKVADHVSHQNLREFNSQALSNLLWACAKCGEPNPMCFKKVADHLVELDNLDNFKPQAVSNLLWAFAKCKEPNPKFFKKVAAHIIALDSLKEFKPQDLSNTVWAFAREEGSNPRLYEKVSDHIVALDNLKEFTSQALSNIVWAYASANESHSLLFEKVAIEAIARKNEFNSQEMANLLWSYATVGQLDSRLFSSMESEVTKCFHKCNSQELANIAWAYAVANVDAPQLFDDHSTFVNACIQMKNEFTIEDLSQLHQWCLWQRELLKSNIALPPSLEKQCYSAFITTVPFISALQKDVISELSYIGLELEEEVLMDGGYRLDALAEVNGSKIGIEVDGPFHFMGRKPTGSTILKRRQVASLEGIPIVSVPYWDWNKYGKERGKRQEYLRSLLGLDSSK
mmetsp:Transcript_33227/g.69905  ORF Transcript_33227/g.69905 Transcript_33227/m.69905 type:complete len:883 (+) Transcript_33227:64-2712(+)